MIVFVEDFVRTSTGKVVAASQPLGNRPGLQVQLTDLFLLFKHSDAGAVGLVEGKIMDLRSVAGDDVVDYRTNALWIRTDEGEDLVLEIDVEKKSVRSVISNQ